MEGVVLMDGRVTGVWPKICWLFEVGIESISVVMFGRG